MKHLGPLFHWPVYLLVRVLVCVVQALTMEQCATLARWLAWLAADVLKVRARVVEENLRLALTDLSEAQRRAVARRMWEHLVLMACEIMLAPRKIHQTNWRRHVTLENARAMVQMMLQPRPRVVLTAHYGNFEVAGYMAGLLGFPTWTVARPLDNPYLDRFLRSFRERTGQHILPKQGISGEVHDMLRAGGSLVLLGDQAAGAKGCWVEFFGRPASCHKAIAVFALASNAPMIVSSTRRAGRPLQFVMAMHDLYDPAADPQRATVQDITQWYSRVLEAAIRTAPEQYWWVHRRWKDDRRPRKSPPTVPPQRRVDPAQPLAPFAAQTEGAAAER